MNASSKNNGFFSLFCTQFLGALNDNFFKNALVILITYKSITLFGVGSKSLVAMAGGIFILPYFLFSSLAGELADKFQKATIIKVTKVTELLVMLIAMLGFLTGNYALLFVVLFLMGAQSAFFGPLKYGILPSLVGQDDLIKANSYIVSGTFIAILMGTILGGISAAASNADTLSSIGVILFAIVGIVASLGVKNVPRHTPDLKVNINFIKSTYDILKISRSDKKVFLSIMGISWFWFLGAAILSVVPALTKDVLGADELVSTVFLSCFTIGMGSGSFLYNKLAKDDIELGVIPPALLVMSLFLVDLAWVGMTWEKGAGLLTFSEFIAKDNSIRALIDLFIASTFGGCYIIPQMAFMQKQSRPEVLSRVIGANNIWNAIFMVVSAIFITILHGLKLSIPEILFIICGLNIVVSFILYGCYSLFSVRFISWILSNIFYKVEIKGRENIPNEGPFVLAGNHVSYVDWMILYGAIPKPVRWVIDYRFYKSGFLKFWLTQAELVPIATKAESPETLKMAFDSIDQALKDKAVIGIFPEGMITINGEINPFKKGIKKIVEENSTSVLPIHLDGLWGSFFSHKDLLFKGKFSLKRRPVTITIGKVMDPQNFDLDSLEAEVKRLGDR